MALERFIISGQPGVLRPLLDLLEHDPETAVHQVTRNSQSDPEQLLVSIDSARAVAMAAALGTLATIENDAVLPDPSQPPNNPMLPPPGPLPPDPVS